MADDTWESRVRETLDYLRQKAQHTFRSSAEGQTIEGAACRLSRRSSWWPNANGEVPIIDEATSK